MAFSKHHNAKTDEGPELEKSWLKVEVSQDDHDTKVEILPSPLHLVGTAIEMQHRVIQVCVGAEHGVMCTDAGIAFTWGDNRYGQLGRPPVIKEENGVPYPVLDLLDEEIVQVAAGKNHCLALTADGFVKAWGRNKQGQLGIGTTRDRTEPKWVCCTPRNEKEEAAGDGPRLGGIAGDRNSIVTISAGGNSSIAAAVNSDVWQWGELNTGFTGLASKDKKKHASKDVPDVSKVKRERPVLVASWRNQSFRTQMRKEKEKVSISELLCMVLDKDDQNMKGRIKDLVEEDKRWRAEIGKERLAESQHREMKEKRQGLSDKGKGSADGEMDGAGLGDLQDTIQFLQRDLDNNERDIDMFNKNIQSYDQQQSHNRKQIEMLTHQATQLTESQGKFSQQMLENKKSGAQKKQLETQLNEIKDFIEANQNTRATLLDQRAETDKEKQRLAAELDNRYKRRDALESRLKMVEYLGSTTKNSTAASDTWVGFLGTEKEELIKHFEGKALLGNNSNILEAKKKTEKDEAYLRNVEMRMAEFLQNARDRGNVGFRPDACKALLDDLVDLRRRLTDLMEDKYFKEDLNFESFFKDAKMPTESA